MINTARHSALCRASWSFVSECPLDDPGIRQDHGLARLESKKRFILRRLENSGRCLLEQDRLVVEGLHKLACLHFLMAEPILDLHTRPLGGQADMLKFSRQRSIDSAAHVVLNLVHEELEMKTLQVGS